MSVELDQKEDEIGYEAVLASGEDAFAKAVKNGWMVVTPGPSDLQIDIDRQEDLELYKKNRQIFDRFKATIGICVEHETVGPSKSGSPGKYHVTLKLNKPVTAEQRILFQCLLGSDRVREILSYVRLK